MKQRSSDLMKKALEKRWFSGAAAGISTGTQAGGKEEVYCFGLTQYGPEGCPVSNKTFFDLASLTKPLATTLAILALIKEKRIRLDDSLPQLLEADLDEDKEKISLRHLLNHSSGLPGYRPFFEKIRAVPEEERSSRLRSLVLAEPLIARPGEKAEYSDLGFMLLGWIIEKKSGKGLDLFVEEKILRPLGLEKKIFFIPRPAKNISAREREFAATEDCPWRGRILRGEVSDENTFVAGGVSGQAGLFGNIGGVLGLTTHLRDQWLGRVVHPSINPADLKRFLTRQKLVRESTWALGFDTPSRPDSSSGRFFSSASVGHLGFTGTSFWIDPDRDLVLVLLTNRVHPSRENQRIREFRPLFHDAVLKDLGLVRRSG